MDHTWQGPLKPRHGGLRPLAWCHPFHVSPAEVSASSSHPASQPHPGFLPVSPWLFWPITGAQFTNSAVTVDDLCEYTPKTMLGLAKAAATQLIVSRPPCWVWNCSVAAGGSQSSEKKGPLNGLEGEGDGSRWQMHRCEGAWRWVATGVPSFGS